MKVSGHDAASSWHNEARKGGSNGSGRQGPRISVSRETCAGPVADACQSSQAYRTTDVPWMGECLWHRLN
jgi:hypothetical protein